MSPQPLPALKASNPNSPEAIAKAKAAFEKLPFEVRGKVNTVVLYALEDEVLYMTRCIPNATRLVEEMQAKVISDKDGFVTKMRAEVLANGSYKNIKPDPLANYGIPNRYINAVYARPHKPASGFCMY